LLVGIEVVLRIYLSSTLLDLICDVFCVSTQLRWLSILLRSVSRFRQFLYRKEAEIRSGNILVYLVRMNVVTTMAPKDTSDCPLLRGGR
jgi:hypothetical protein